MPLFGTRKLERFEENIGALNIQLSQADLIEIGAAGYRVEGERYPEDLMKRSGL